MVVATACYSQHSRPNRGLRCARRRRRASSGYQSAGPDRHRRHSSGERLLGRGLASSSSRPAPSLYGSVAGLESEAPNRPHSRPPPAWTSLSGGLPHNSLQSRVRRTAPPLLIASLRRPRRIVGAVAPSGPAAPNRGEAPLYMGDGDAIAPVCAADVWGRQPPPSARRRSTDVSCQGGPGCTGPTASRSRGRPPG